MMEENEHTGAYSFVAYLELAKINSQEDPKQVEISFTSLGNVHSEKITEHDFNSCKIFFIWRLFTYVYDINRVDIPHSCASPMLVQPWPLNSNYSQRI